MSEVIETEKRKLLVDRVYATFKNQAYVATPMCFDKDGILRVTLPHPHDRVSHVEALGRLVAKSGVIKDAVVRTMRITAPNSSSRTNMPLFAVQVCIHITDRDEALAATVASLVDSRIHTRIAVPKAPELKLDALQWDTMRDLVNDAYAVAPISEKGWHYFMEPGSDAVSIRFVVVGGVISGATVTKLFDSLKEKYPRIVQDVMLWCEPPFKTVAQSLDDGAASSSPKLYLSIETTPRGRKRKAPGPPELVQVNHVAST